MTSVVERLLVELHHLGVIPYRVGDKIRLGPADVLTPDILARVKAAKPELLPILPEKPAPVPIAGILANATIYTAPFTVYGTPEDAPAIIWAEETQHPDVVRTLGVLGRRCEDLVRGTDENALHVAVERLAGYLRTIREAYEADQAPLEAPEPVATTPGQWRLVVGAMKLKPAPVQLDAARRVTDVPAFVESTLAEVERTVALRNSGRGTYLSDVTDERLEQLRLCGCEVSVELTQ